MAEAFQKVFKYKNYGKQLLTITKRDVVLKNYLLNYSPRNSTRRTEKEIAGGQ